MPFDIGSAAGMASSLGVGAAAMKLLDHWFGRKSKQIDELTQFRRDLLEQIEKLQDRVTEVEREVDEWRTKYYSLLEESIRRPAPCAECPLRSMASR